MQVTASIPIKKINHSRIQEVNPEDLDFGKYMSDHMLIAKYENGAWKNAEIVPYGDITLAPTALALHYGQSVFEGMKAFRMQDNKVSIFRIDKHFERFNKSLERMCMPSIPYSIFNEGLKTLIALDAAWVPGGENQSLYIRPLLFASEPRFGVKVSEEYMFIIMSGPVDYFYAKPLKVKIEDKYRRAVKGGTGAAKCAGNYGGTFYPNYLVKQEGYDQVFWTDGSDDLFIEESGTMNAMFMIDGKLITPALSDSILAGVTRDSVITLAKEMGITVEERSVSTRELVAAYEKGILTEVFGTGTAAITAPISLIGIKEKQLKLPEYTDKSFCIKARKTLTEIRQGIIPDKFGWNTVV